MRKAYEVEQEVFVEGEESKLCPREKEQLLQVGMRVRVYS